MKTNLSQLSHLARPPSDLLALSSSGRWKGGSQSVGWKPPRSDADEKKTGECNDSNQSVQWHQGWKGGPGQQTSWTRQTCLWTHLQWLHTRAHTHTEGGMRGSVTFPRSIKTQQSRMKVWDSLPSAAEFERGWANWFWPGGGWRGGAWNIGGVDQPKRQNEKWENCL